MCTAYDCCALSSLLGAKRLLSRVYHSIQVVDDELLAEMAGLMSASWEEPSFHAAEAFGILQLMVYCHLPAIIRGNTYIL